MDTDIVAVTVYPADARVTRRGRTRLDAGRQRVVVGGLPLGLRPESVRAAARGAATVLGVDVAYEHHPRSPDASVDELRQRRDGLRLRLDELSDADAVEHSRSRLLGAVARQSGKAFGKALATATTEASTVAALNDALAGQLADVLARRRELNDRRIKTQEELAEVDRQLELRSRLDEPDRQAITVEFEVGQAGSEVELEVSYVVGRAHWESHYDVRLVDDTLTLTWYGMVSQDSGEDWPECELRLSTARPADSVRVPELEPWYLDRAHPRPQARRMAGFAAPISAAPAAMSQDKAMAETAAAQVATASVEHGAAAATYTPIRPVAVPADGSAHRTTVTVEEFEARLDHVTAPAQALEAYLRATVVNGSEHTLRPGRAAVFHGAEFVGTTELESWAPGEEVELALGVDDRIRVERELVRRTAGKATVGRTRRREAEYRITIGNYGRRKANVTVLDQVPVSRDEGIVVRDVRSSPKPAEETELGELTWRLSLEPGKAAEITFGFRVDLAKGVELAGWRA